MDEPEWYGAWRHDAYHELLGKNEALKTAFKLGTWRRWYYDLDSESLTYSHEGKPKVVARIQVVGSIGSRSKTWLWAWANEWWPKATIEDAILTKQFGEQHRIAELVTASLADENLLNLGWEMAAVMARVTNAKGVFYAPGDNGGLFLTYREIAFAS